MGATKRPAPATPPATPRTTTRKQLKNASVPRPLCLIRLPALIPSLPTSSTRAQFVTSQLASFALVVLVVRDGRGHASPICWARRVLELVFLRRQPYPRLIQSIVQLPSF